MDQWIREQFKSKGGFGKTTLESRRSASLINRKEHRNVLLSKLRNIPENNKSPYMTPNVSQVKKVQDKNPVTSQSGTSRRIELLKKWKEEKEKKKLELKKKAKPPFKVFHVDQTDKLEDIYKNIKGKPISSGGKVPLKLGPQNKVNENKYKSNLKSDKSNAQYKLTDKVSEKSQNSQQKKVPNRTYTQATTGGEIRTRLAKQQKGVKEGKTATPKIQKGQRKIENLKNSKTNSKMSGKSRELPVSNKHAFSNENNQLNTQRISEEMCSKNNCTIERKDQPENVEETISEVQRKLTRSQKKSITIQIENTEELTPKKRSTRKTSTKLLAKNKSPSKDIDSSPIEHQQINMDNEDGRIDDDEESQNRRSNIRTTRLTRQNICNSDIDNTSTEQQIQQKTPRRRSRRTRKKTTEEESMSSANSQEKVEMSETPLKNTPISPKKSIQINSDSKDSVKTPTKELDEICYISPFVTVSRGKVAARKEFEKRKSLNGSVLNNSISGTTDPRSPKAAAVYFTKKLEMEIERIQELCGIWQNYKDEADLSEDACGLIDMTIGQSNLLITKKFNQFRGLIEKCQTNDELDMRIKCEDLHGFWDMMYKQVTDLEKRFQNLEDMKKNNWLEKEQKKKTPKIAAKEKKKSGPKKVSKASSTLKETILAARRNRMKIMKSEGDVEILIASKNKTPSRRSKNKEHNEISTPARGILKSSSVKSEQRKTVMFQNVRESIGDNSLSSKSVIKGTPLPSRKSARLSLNKSKLVFD